MEPDFLGLQEMPFTSCGTLGTFLKFSLPQFLHEDNDVVLYLPHKKYIRYISNIRYYLLDKQQPRRKVVSYLLTK